MNSSALLLTSSFLSCSAPPATVTDTVTSTFTTTYCVTFLAACSISQWPATYTIEETCTGNPATWTTPQVSSNFVTSVVTCDSCATPTITITCPNAMATGPATVICGNGVTATMPAATGAAGSGSGSGMGGMGSGSGSGSAGSGTGSGSDMGSGSGSGMSGMITTTTPMATMPMGSSMPAQTGYVTAGAPSLKKNVLLALGATAVAVFGLLA